MSQPDDATGAGPTAPAPAARAEGGVLGRAVLVAAYASAGIGAAALAALCLVVVINVVLRATVNGAFPAALDLVSYWWMPLVAILPLALTGIQGRHLSAGIILDALEGWPARIVGIAVTALAAVVLAALTWYGFQSAVEKALINEHGLVARWLPIWPIRFLVALGLLVATLQMAHSLIEHVRGRAPRHEETPEAIL